MAITPSRTANPAGVAASGNVAAYSGQSIGAASPERVIVLFVGTELTNSGPTAATIDTGGGPVAMNAGTLGNLGAIFARAFWLKVPTGTTADFAITFGATNPTAAQNHITVWRLVGGSAAPTSENVVNDTDADPLTTAALTIPTNGAMLAMCADAVDTTARTWAGTGGLTKLTDEASGTGGFRFSDGSSTTAGSSTTTVSGANLEDASFAYVIFDELLTVTPSLHSDTDSFFAPTVAQVQSLTPSFYTDSDSIFVPTFAVGAVSFAPSLYTDSESVFAPTVSPGAVTVTPSLYTDTDTFFSPTVATAYAISPLLYDDAETFFAPTVSSGGGQIFPSMFTDADTFYIPAITTGAANIVPLLHEDADQFFVPVVQFSGPAIISPSLFIDEDLIYDPASINRIRKTTIARSRSASKLAASKRMQ